MFGRIFFLTFALVAFALLFSTAQHIRSEESDSLSVIVAHPSYAAPMPLADLVRHQHLREAVIFTLKRAHASVISELALPWRQPRCEYFPAERWYSIEHDAALIEIQIQSDGSTEIVVHAAQDQTVTRVQVPANFADALPFAERAVADLMSATKRAKPAALKVSGALDLNFIAALERLDAGFAERIAALQILLRTLDVDGLENPNIHAQLAVAFAQHACYFTRAQELDCHATFGRALLHAELIATAADATPSAKTLRDDIRWLALRYAAGYQAPPLHKPLLPEVVLTTEYESKSAAEVGGNVRQIAYLFDFHVQHEAVRAVRGQDSAVQMFAYTSPRNIDAGLIWSRDLDAESSLFVTDRVPKNVWLRELSAIAEATDYRENLTPIVSHFQDVAKRNPYDLLDNDGTRAREKKEAQTDGDTLVILGLSNFIEEQLRKGDLESDTFALRFADVFPELLDRATQLVRARQARMSQLGAADKADEIGQMLMRFGRERARSLRCFPGAPVLRVEAVADWAAFLAEFKTKAVDDKVSGIRTVWARLPAEIRNSIENGDYTTASLPTIQHAIISIVNANDDAFDAFTHVPYVMSKSFGDATGKLNLRLDSAYQRELDIAYRRFLKCVMSGDNVEAARILQPFADRFENQSKLVFPYFWNLVRAGRLEEGLDWLCKINNKGAGRDEAASTVLAWKRDHFSSAQIEILGARSGENPQWKTLNKSPRLDDAATINRVNDLCSSSHTLKDVRAGWEAVRHVNRSFTKAEDDNGNLFGFGLRVEHLSLAKRILLETENLKRPVSAEALTDMTDLIQRTQAYQRTMGRARHPFPFDAWVLKDMALWGCDAQKAAAIIAQFPDAKILFEAAGPKFAFFVANPNALGLWLQSMQDAGTFLEDAKAEPHKIEPPWAALFARAFYDGNDELALKFALREAAENQSIDALAYYWASDDDAKKWIAENAPTVAARQYWTQRFQQLRPNLEPHREARQALKPITATVPNLLAYLAPH